MSCGCGREQTQNVTKLQNQIARLEGELEKWRAAYQREVRAVEKVAREKAALAEAKDALIQEGLNALDSYQVTSKFDEALALTPAEAQEEDDGD